MCIRDSAVPLIVVCIGVSIVTYWACFILGKRVLPKNGQFETGIGLFGQCCGCLLYTSRCV